MKEDLELKQFRELMPPPDRWEEGFGLKAVIGGIFVGLLMTPASMYGGLIIGQDVGAAAQWVTIILFIEVARRAFTTLRRPEIYVLYYMAGATLVSGSATKASGISRAAPARCISWALRNWWLSVEAPNGMKIAARPAAATSATVIAPARQTIRSACANRSAIFPMKGSTSALISRRA